jgi:hypothetical protein
MQHEILAAIKHKLSIIYKHIQLMHNELRYQGKTHTISEKLPKEKNKILHLLPQFFFNFFNFYVENNKTVKKRKKEKQQGHAHGKGNNI